MKPYKVGGVSLIVGDKATTIWNFTLDTTPL
jgi:hypothetical protein